jgi:plasmid stability protein
MGTLVQIRDVPDPIHRKLKARAAQRGASLSEYLRQELERIAATPTNQELRERLARREPVHLSETPAEAIRAIRDHGE